MLINLQSDNSREYFIIFFHFFFVYFFVLAVQYCFSDRDYDGDCRKTPEYSVAIQLYTVRFYNYIYYQRYLNVKLYFKMFTRVASLFFPYGFFVFVLLVCFFLSCLFVLFFYFYIERLCIICFCGFTFLFIQLSIYLIVKIRYLRLNYLSEYHLN